jgi:glutamate synthase (NADPH/NADH) small chain
VEDDIGKAYEIIRKTNVLPEMCSHLCPVGSLCEGPCVTNTLEGNPIPIHDIQYAVCWNARHSGLTGVRVPLADTGKRIAIVGGGPAGIACAVTLLERGHHVVLFERASRLGGTPERLIRSSRFTGAAAEVEAILQPALREARLTLKFGCELGKDLALEELRHEHDAVFLAAGVWGERSLGRPEGVLDGVTFLQKARAGEIEKVPSKVIILAGGDCAMDCAMVARELGARELTIVYAGALSEMHWHMPDSWFRTEGVNFMTQTRPMGYALEVGGKVSGLYVRMNLVVGPDKVPGTEYLMETGMVIEAMGLGLEKSLEEALVGCQFSEEGLVKTRGGASLSCGLSGVYAGGGMINGGAAVVQCIEEGMRAGCEIDDFLTP